MAEYFSPFVPADPLLDYVGQATPLPPLYSLLLGWAGSSGSDLEQVHLALDLAFFTMALDAIAAKGGVKNLGKGILARCSQGTGLQYVGSKKNE